MSWTVSNPVSVGLATKKAHYDALWDNCDFFKIQHGTDGTHGAVTATSVTPANLTASLPVFSDGSKKLVSNTMTGTGKVVMDTSPTLVTPTIGAAAGTSLSLSGLTASLPVFTDGSKALVSKSVADTLKALGIGEWTDYDGTSTVIGWSSFTTKDIQYTDISNLRVFIFSLVGTSNSTAASFTIPSVAASPRPLGCSVTTILCLDNSSTVDIGYAILSTGDNITVNLYLSTFGGAWTAANTKSAKGMLMVTY